MARNETDPFRVDWFQVLEDLWRAGIPVASVAAHIRCRRQGSTAVWLEAAGN